MAASSAKKKNGSAGKNPAKKKYPKACDTSVLGWFNSHTFHNSQFSDVDRLIELKQQQGRKISLGIPTLNEEKNVSHVISTLKKALFDEKHLVDEIAIIDSGSTDRTVEIAEKLGARVITSERHLKEMDIFYGKGENLWKSLHTLRGDIICWVDADIENIHPKFVYGLVGPLLEQRELGYVKGFYRRPLKFGGKIVSYGGGRVTEICIRPIFNLYFPDLTGFIQPLSGEYAGKRKVLEQVPFFVGYGVETGLLIDISKRFGLNAMAQVDLDERVHRNQETVALGRMAFGIMQVIAARLSGREREQFLKEFCTVYRFPEIKEPEKEGGERQYFLNEKEIVERERPPIRKLHDYRMKKAWNKDLLAKMADFLRESKRRHRQ